MIKFRSPRASSSAAAMATNQASARGKGLSDPTARCYLAPSFDSRSASDALGTFAERAATARPSVGPRRDVTAAETARRSRDQTACRPRRARRPSCIGSSWHRHAGPEQSDAPDWTATINARDGPVGGRTDRWSLARDDIPVTRVGFDLELLHMVEIGVTVLGLALHRHHSDVRLHPSSFLRLRCRRPAKDRRVRQVEQMSRPRTPRGDNYGRAPRGDGLGVFARSTNTRVGHHP